MTDSNRERAIIGAILGTAVGDAIGLPFEGLPRTRVHRVIKDPLSHQFFFGRGMVSDDTEHTCMVAQSLIAADTDDQEFARQLARRLRLWLLALPAGTGLATLRATLRLCVGVPPSRSGVFSAGNGPAMRSAVVGAAVDDLDDVARFVRVSSTITHTDPKAEFGALAVALAAHLAARQSNVNGGDYLVKLKEMLADREADQLLDLIARAVGGAGKVTVAEFADSLDLSRGITGYVYHTVPVAIHAWLTHQDDFRSALTEIVRCGGDTDSTGAIVGGIVGSAVGKSGIPDEWLNGIVEWPRSVRWMQRLGRQLSDGNRNGETKRPVRLPATGILIRNVLFLVIVLLHGFRRLLPPY